MLTVGEGEIRGDAQQRDTRQPEPISICSQISQTSLTLNTTLGLLISCRQGHVSWVGSQLVGLFCVHCTHYGTSALLSFPCNDLSFPIHYIQSLDIFQVLHIQLRLVVRLLYTGGGRPSHYISSQDSPSWNNIPISTDMISVLSPQQTKIVLLFSSQ